MALALSRMKQNRALIYQGFLRAETSLGRKNRVGILATKHRSARPLFRFPVLADVFEEVLPEDQHPFADLMKPQAASPHYTPRGLPDA
jgi:hypothetical protein